ncbi:hypothetical protein BDY19DRAFT_946737 [Irpex rosettiformis]|uniref:Uncharacterized protein n=1 Tax=Irpex rosettiformis TaxID=378272 RepID=A0ACB8U3G3_9APHY|nr:hypothetical protein BDY19DRAFT_946737 [Irpex rosettiformis]
MLWPTHAVCMLGPGWSSMNRLSASDQGPCLIPLVQDFFVPGHFASGGLSLGDSKLKTYERLFCKNASTDHY